MSSCSLEPFPFRIERSSFISEERVLRRACRLSCLVCDGPKCVDPEESRLDGASPKVDPKSATESIISALVSSISEDSFSVESGLDMPSLLLLIISLSATSLIFLEFPCRHMASSVPELIPSTRASSTSTVSFCLMISALIVPSLSRLIILSFPGGATNFCSSSFPAFGKTPRFPSATLIIIFLFTRPVSLSVPRGDDVGLERDVSTRPEIKLSTFISSPTFFPLTSTAGKSDTTSNSNGESIDDESIASIVGMSMLRTCSGSEPSSLRLGSTARPRRLRRAFLAFIALPTTVCFSGVNICAISGATKSSISRIAAACSLVIFRRRRAFSRFALSTASFCDLNFFIFLGFGLSNSSTLPLNSLPALAAARESPLSAIREIYSERRIERSSISS